MAGLVLTLYGVNMPPRDSQSLFSAPVASTGSSPAHATDASRKTSSQKCPVGPRGSGTSSDWRTRRCVVCVGPRALRDCADWIAYSCWLRPSRSEQSLLDASCLWRALGVAGPDDVRRVVSRPGIRNETSRGSVRAARTFPMGSCRRSRLCTTLARLERAQC